MRQSYALLSLGVSALGFALQLTACGDFSADEPPGKTTNGGSGTGMGGTGTDTGGTGTDTGGTGTDTGGTGGTATDTGGTATGGSSGGAEPSAGAGGTPMFEEPPEASCDNVIGCGGDVVGVWFAVKSCLNVSGMADLTAHGIGCREAAASGTLEVTGNWTVTEDGVNDTTQTTGTLELKLEPECKDVSGTVTQCDSIAGPMWASLGFVREGSTCVDSVSVEGGCDCTGTLDQKGVPGFVTLDVSPMAVYETMDNSLKLSGFTEVDYDYCVDGNFMHLTPTTSNDIGTVTGTVVFQRQP